MNGVFPSRRTEMMVRRTTGSPFVAGLDEVGRGAWAGPMVAAAAVIPFGVKISGVRDSKLLNEDQREEAAHAIRLNASAWSYGVVIHEEIDRMGLTEANRLVFERALYGLREPVSNALIDGGYRFRLPCACTYVKDGDHSEFLIAAASILAKVFRDALLRSAHHLFPEYSFHRNKGYGTQEHQKALRKYGITPLHRKTFIPVCSNNQ